MTKKHLHRRVLSTLLGSALLCSVTSGRAAEEIEATYMLDEVVVTANRISTKVMETAANVTVISRDDIEKGGFTSVTEALKSANVNVQGTGGRATDSAVPHLNGDKRVLVLVDGRRVTWDANVVVGRQTNDLNSLPSLDSIERIEVVRGAASSLYGSDAVGGVINIITRSGKEFRTSVTLETGSWGQRKYSIVTEGKSGDISYLLTAEQERQDNYSYKDYKTGKVVKYPNTQSEKDGITFKLDKAIDENHMLTLFFDHKQEDVGMPVRTPGSIYFSPDGLEKILNNNIALAYRWQQEQNAEGNLRIYRNYNTTKYYNSATGFGTYSDSAYRNSANGVDWNQSWRIGSNHTLVAGSEWRQAKMDSPDGSLSAKASNSAVFVEDRWQMGDVWTITPGARYDHHSVFGGKTTTHLTANCKITDAANVYASWGQSFTAPA
ncbi:MAG: TonB-dependent receptor plug domain-containing protein, partial [Sporomusa sp.]